MTAVDTHQYARHGPASFAILLVPKFPIYVLTLMIEAMRIANKTMAGEVYEWRILTADGRPAEASNGMTVGPHGDIGENRVFGNLCVLSGYAPEQAYDGALIGWLRRQARLGARIGGVDTGAFVLARAGLLDDVPVVVHWEAANAFREEYPLLTLSDDLFSISGNRFTCAGGAAALDLMLNIIALERGISIARKVTQDFIHDHIRTATDGQRMALDHQWRRQNPDLARVLTLMEDTLEEPLPADDLVAASTMSKRRLERCFQRDVGTSMMRHYRQMRLNRARHLVLYTKMPIREVAIACGYSGLSVFSRSYAAQFGQSPRLHRARFKSSGYVPQKPEWKTGLHIESGVPDS